MAVTVEVGPVAVAIRAATDPDAIDGTVARVLALMLPAAATMVLQYAPAAPDEMHNVAAIRLVGWMYDADASDPSLGRAMQLSGAANLLSQWRVHRAGAVGPALPTPAPEGGAVPEPPGTGNWILTSNNGVLTWVEFPQP